MSIIVEGPDGAGKTTLIQDLQGHFPEMELHPRFCTSRGGPIEGLAEEVYRDVVSKPTHFIYDRHPVISDYVYNAAIPERSYTVGFLTDTMGRLRNRVAHHSLTIWCLPPLSQVRFNCRKDEEAGNQMSGVFDNIEKIYDGYHMHRLLWPGRSVIYDYTNSAMSWEGLSYALNDTRNKLWKEHA